MSETGQLYFGGEIHTVDEERPAAEAVAVRDGRILAVGSESDCRMALGEDYESIDLRGSALLPGFIDTHLHPVVMICPRRMWLIEPFVLPATTCC